MYYLCSGHRNDFHGVTMTSLVRLFILCAVLVSQVVRGCPDGWESYSGSCYFVSDMREDWSAALTTCGIYHANLAEIRDVHEDNFVKQLVTKYHYKQTHDTYFWLGGTDTFVESDWRWIGSNDRLNYTHWGHREPNDNHGEDCLGGHLIGSNFYWMDLECTIKYNFVCEIQEGNTGISGGIVIG